MYDTDRAAVQAWWRGIAAALRDEGVDDVPDMLAWPADLEVHWREPALLLSQTCGYPLVTRLSPLVHVVGAFRYTAPGCDGIDYRSELLVRSEDADRTVSDWRGRSVAFNDSASFSGWHALRALVAPLAIDGRFFGSGIESGSHRASLRLLRGGQADIAAIDCVTLALLRRHAADELAGLASIGHTPSAPGLPLVTAGATPPWLLSALRRALQAACADPALAATRAALFIEGFEAAPELAWQRIESLCDAAAGLRALPVRHAK